MNYNQSFTERARREIQSRKIRAEKDALERKAEICAKSPEFCALETEHKKYTTELLTSMISGAPPEKITSIKNHFLALTKKQNEILVKLGFAEDYLMPRYSCPFCHDEGIQENGRECICLKTVRNKLRYAEFCREFPLEDYSFDNFSLAYYTSEKEKSKMQFIYDTCKTYADHFPKDARNLLLSGGTGLGKTHLSLAIAREVINKGYQVLYNSAQNFLSSVQQETFGKVPPGALENLLSCDLLIIDDLGVEFSTQFSISAIYNIINTRSINKRRTIINTNLSLEEVEEKYGERIFSRLVGCYDWLRFVGKDIRIQKKAKTTKQK